MGTSDLQRQLLLILALLAVSPISCYSVHLSDSVQSIYSHLKEVAALSKNGGGVGVYFGDIRPAGSPITAEEKALGVVPWAQQYDLAASVVSQGGVRRGSFAIYMPITHPDLPELLRSKDHSQGDPRKFIDSNVAVTVDDEFINSMLAGDVEKQKLFGEVMKIRMVSGLLILYISTMLIVKTLSVIINEALRFLPLISAPRFFCIPTKVILLFAS